MDHHVPAVHVTVDEVEQLADLFSQTADPTRLRVLLFLLEGEQCVCSISEQLDVSVSAVSHQLRRLRTGGLISRRKQGRHVYYALADDHVRTLISVGLEHIRE
ncbi:MAG: winged helix-turn-helix transcriptional regulator [Candidatus Sabulitectum sp.]|nr:winged helix-turn-helix transcriptional regulator [Candidatus Sabulitectum sp.]